MSGLGIEGGMSDFGGEIQSSSRFGLAPSRMSQSTLGTWNWDLKSNYTEELEIYPSSRLGTRAWP